MHGTVHMSSASSILIFVFRSFLFRADEFSVFTSFRLLADDLIEFVDQIHFSLGGRCQCYDNSVRFLVIRKETQNAC